jgi:ADP-heptose:LPS heptosyltransferase
MHGLGDNLHQRSVIRQLAAKHDVWLETSWPCVYWDMPELNLMARGTKLRTQVKNSEREADRFTRAEPPRAPELTVRYPPRAVKEHGSVLKAMSNICGVPPGDFRLPIKPEWLAKADALIAALKPQKPLMFFRPLVERVEWTGGKTRNPDPQGFAELFRLIADRFFVVSIADLVKDVEWEVGQPLKADVRFHRGELDIETVFGLASRSALMFGAPGFQTVMGQAIGTPGVTVFGGYEDASSFSSGAVYAPWLPIEPIRPCPCWTHHHQCRKRIDVQNQSKRLLEFVEAHCKL